MALATELRCRGCRPARVCVGGPRRTWGRAVRIFVCGPPTDRRRGFDGLAAPAQTGTRRDPLRGHLLVFFNRRRERVKILYGDPSGYCLWYKRLEAGPFALSGSAADQDRVEGDLPRVRAYLDPAPRRTENMRCLGEDITEILEYIPAGC
jgi:transposase